MGELASESSLVVFGVEEGSVLVALLILTWVEFNTIALSGASASLVMFEKECCFFLDNYSTHRLIRIIQEQCENILSLYLQPLTPQYLIRISHST